MHLAPGAHRNLPDFGAAEQPLASAIYRAWLSSIYTMLPAILVLGPYIMKKFGNRHRHAEISLGAIFPDVVQIGPASPGSSEA